MESVEKSVSASLEECTLGLDVPGNGMICLDDCVPDCVGQAPCRTWLELLYD